MAVKPRARSASARIARPDPTDAGDATEVSLTVEINDRQGRKVWAKIAHTGHRRNDESAEDAYNRVESFVVGRIENLIETWQEETE